MRTYRREERGSIAEAVLWAGAALGIAAFFGYVVLAKPWQEKPIELTPEEQAYVQAVATQQAEAYIAAVATMQADQAENGAAAPSQSTSYDPPAPSQPAPQQPLSQPPQQAPSSQPEQPPPPPPAPTATLAAKPPPPPAATKAPPAPPPPPPDGSNKPPMARCVGYMAGFSSEGYEDCVSIVQTADYDTSHCVGYIIGSPGTDDGKAACVQVALKTDEDYLGDCLMGLTGQSHFGATACRIYYDNA
jgi:hypothetical protein